MYVLIHFSLLININPRPMYITNQIFVVDYDVDVFAAWQLRDLFNSLGLSEENTLKLEKEANSSILEILSHEAYVYSLGRVTKFLRTTPEAQLVARDALIADRLKDTIKGKDIFNLIPTYLFIMLTIIQSFVN